MAVLAPVFATQPCWPSREPATYGLSNPVLRMVPAAGQLVEKAPSSKQADSNHGSSDTKRPIRPKSALNIRGPRSSPFSRMRPHPDIHAGLRGAHDEPIWGESRNYPTLRDRQHARGPTATAGIQH